MRVNVNLLIIFLHFMQMSFIILPGRMLQGVQEKPPRSFAPWRFAVMLRLTRGAAEGSRLRGFSDQLDDAHFGCISSAGAGLDYTAITAVYILVLGSNFIKEFLYYVLFCDIGKNLTL